MQKVILTIVLFFTGLVYSQAQETFSLTLSISGMKSDKGDVYVALYNAEKGFLKKTFKTTMAFTETKSIPRIIK